MRKLVVLVAMLALATCAFAQLSYVGSSYTGPNAARTAQDTKLGMHDVMALPTAHNASTFPANGPSGTVIAERNGCQSCHTPHTATAEYIWKYTLTTTLKNQDGSSMALDEASFHTLACVTCHDGVDAPDVYAALPGGAFPSYAQMGAGGDLTHEHPLNAMLAQHGATAPPRQYIRFYTPAGVTLTVNKDANGNLLSGTQFGYVECGSCHDPHKGDGNTYMFLRGPSAGVTPQYARLDLCRQCHGK